MTVQSLIENLSLLDPTADIVVGNQRGLSRPNLIIAERGIVAIVSTHTVSIELGAPSCYPLSVTPAVVLGRDES